MADVPDQPTTTYEPDFTIKAPELENLNVRFDHLNRQILLLTVAIAAIAISLMLTQLRVHKLIQEIACRTD